MKTKILSISAVVFGLLLLSIHHLGYSFGDDLFRWAGIPPWTDIGRKTGLHLPVVAAMVLLIFGIRGIVKIYKPVYPKILSRTLLVCAVFIFYFSVSVGTDALSDEIQLDRDFIGGLFHERQPLQLSIRRKESKGHVQPQYL
ncbi:hypothetical protein [Paenibacillus sp. DMB20]|uniref:hypothetical protein n=1 Tax=Paenibacillus sp. DMB20 TaxID=1642570 RepID=UPI00069B3D16|nr:hypothetical protein [Paenibacillus sp. DMB20]